MSEEARSPAEEAVLASLTPEQRAQLEAERVLRVDNELIWIEAEGRVRKQPVAKLYYVRTSLGMFRWSKIDDALVEV
jgi:hypothetical protein